MEKRHFEAFKAYRMAAPAYAEQGTVLPEFDGKSYAGIDDGKGRAAYALKKLRAALEAGTPDYRLPYPPSKYREESDGLRYVGRVVPESADWDNRDSCGWQTDPYGDVFKDGTGLCFGVVYQLPARNGVARFVGGYEFGGTDGGPTLDLTHVCEVQAGEYNTSAQEMARESGIMQSADHDAKQAGEKEREYQTAWQAGRKWRESLDELKEARQEALGVLKERRELMADSSLLSGTKAFPALCAALQQQVSILRCVIREAREAMAELAQGDDSDLIFWPGDDQNQQAFCEGAELDSMPGAAT